MKKILFIASIFFISLTMAAQDTTALTLRVGDGSKYSAINVKDAVTGNYVTATITNLSVQNNNPDVATIIPNPNSQNSIKATGLKAGTGTATVSCDVSYVDAGDGLQKNESKTIVINYTVIAEPHGVTLLLAFN